MDTEAWVLGGAVELLSKMRKCAFKLRYACFQGLETRVATTPCRSGRTIDFIRVEILVKVVLVNEVLVNVVQVNVVP